MVRFCSDDSAICYVLMVLWMTYVITKWGQWAKINHDIVSSRSPSGGIRGEVYLILSATASCFQNVFDFSAGVLCQWAAQTMAPGLPLSFCSSCSSVC